MITLKEQLQLSTKQARTLNAIVNSILKDMVETANQGGTFVSWRECDWYYPNIKLLDVLNSLNAYFTEHNAGLKAELKDNSERINRSLEKRQERELAGKRILPSIPDMKQWLIVSWED